VPARAPRNVLRQLPIVLGVWPPPLRCIMCATEIGVSSNHGRVEECCISRQPTIWVTPTCGFQELALKRVENFRAKHKRRYRQENGSYFSHCGLFLHPEHFAGALSVGGPPPRARRPSQFAAPAALPSCYFAPKSCLPVNRKGPLRPVLRRSGSADVGEALDAALGAFAGVIARFQKSFFAGL
jgi:hypothetical protein